MLTADGNLAIKSRPDKNKQRVFIIIKLKPIQSLAALPAEEISLYSKLVKKSA